MPEKEADLELFGQYKINKLTLEAKIEEFNFSVLSENKKYHVITYNCQNYIIDLFKGLNLAHS